MHKSATKCNETIGKWCKNKHGASKIIDTFETYHIFTSHRAAASQVRPTAYPDPVTDAKATTHPSFSSTLGFPPKR
jgi:hypothetical protein